MRYLKRFNESVDLESQLRDFSESYLAYLLDDGYKIQVSPTNLKTQFLISLGKVDNEVIDFTWLDVKESYIPFLHMLNRDYNIIDQTIEFYDGDDDTEFDIETILSGNPLPNGYDNESLLEILVWINFDKPIKESVELNIDEIEHYLAYLIDEGFEVKPIIPGGGFADVKPQQAICLERKLSREEWQSILKTGLEHKSVIIGVRSEPMKVHNPSQFKPAVLLSNFKCNLLDSIEYLAQDSADKLLLSLSDQFSTTKIIMSFKVGPGFVQRYDFGDISIRLQIILID